MPACSNCGIKLRKEDVQRIVEIDATNLEWKEVKKLLMCKVCGHVLMERKP